MSRVVGKRAGIAANVLLAVALARPSFPAPVVSATADAPNRSIAVPMAVHNGFSTTMPLGEKTNKKEGTLTLSARPSATFDAITATGDTLHLSLDIASLTVASPLKNPKEALTSADTLQYNGGMVTGTINVSIGGAKVPLRVLYYVKQLDAVDAATRKMLESVVVTDSTSGFSLANLPSFQTPVERVRVTYDPGTNEFVAVGGSARFASYGDTGRDENPNVSGSLGLTGIDDAVRALRGDVATAHGNGNSASGGAEDRTARNGGYVRVFYSRGNPTGMEIGTKYPGTDPGSEGRREIPTRTASYQSRNGPVHALVVENATISVSPAPVERNIFQRVAAFLGLGKKPAEPARGGMTVSKDVIVGTGGWARPTPDPGRKGNGLQKPGVILSRSTLVALNAAGRALGERDSVFSWKDMNQGLVVGTVGPGQGIRIRVSLQNWGSGVQNVRGGGSFVGLVAPSPIAEPWIVAKKPSELTGTFDVVLPRDRDGRVVFTPGKPKPGRKQPEPRMIAGGADGAPGTSGRASPAER